MMGMVHNRLTFLTAKGANSAEIFSFRALGIFSGEKKQPDFSM